MITNPEATALVLRLATALEGSAQSFHAVDGHGSSWPTCRAADCDLARRLVAEALEALPPTEPPEESVVLVTLSNGMRRAYQRSTAGTPTWWEATQDSDEYSWSQLVAWSIGAPVQVLWTPPAEPEPAS